MAYPVVLRFQEMWPGDMKGIRMHAQRAGGDLSHINSAKTADNELLIGDEFWKERVLHDLNMAKRQNKLEEVKAKGAKSDKKGAARREREGPKDPWKPGRKTAPMREGLLTANAEFFRDQGFGDFDFWDSEKVAAFKRTAVDWLEKEFGEACVYARYDLDEKAPHVSFVVAPWDVKTTKSRGTQRMLVPSKYQSIASYERGQDDVGLTFSELGLTRGKRRAEKKREDLEAGREPEPDPVWQHPLDKRREEADRASHERKKSEKERAASEAAEKRAAEERAQAKADREAAEARLAEATRRERAAAAAQAKADRDAERQRKRDAELAERERAAAEKDRQTEVRRQDVERREGLMRETVRQWLRLYEPMRRAAERLGLIEDPTVKEGLYSGMKADRIFGQRQGREKVRGD